MRQRSSIESFLDDYQAVRLYLGAAALVVTAVFFVGGWTGDHSPLPSIIVLGVIAGHAAWCRLRSIRAPRTMLLIDTTLLGLIMFTLDDTPSTMVGIYGFLALIIVLFAEGRWMAAFLTYVTGWHLAAFFSTVGVSAESIAESIGNLFAIGALVVVMIRVRRWLDGLDAGRSQMIGTVSHELRNSLTGVMGLTEIVAGMADMEPAEARELVAMAHLQAVDASEIVEDLLTAARLEAAALTIHQDCVDLNAEVATVVRRFHESDYEIGLALAEDLAPAWADALRVRQTVRNLVSNAIRYGGPTTTVMTRQVDAAIQIVVRDNGDGVPEEEVGTIFLPYRRSMQGRRHASSIGLGLWISRTLVQAMGGKLDYQRHDGFTEFVMTLPTASSDQRHPATDAPGSAPSRPASELPTPFGALSATSEGA